MGGVLGGGGAYNRIFFLRVGEGCYKRQFTDMLTGRWALNLRVGLGGGFL